jgi:hypothetical protein
MTMSETSGDSVVCENIGPRERAKRMRFGVVSGVVAVGLGAVLVATHAPRVTRLTVFVPLVLAGLGVFQAREHTCVANVARRVRNMDEGDAPVTDAGDIRQLALQARRVYVKAFASAAAATIVLLVLP